MEWKEAGLGRKKHGRNAVSVKSSWPQREHCSWDGASELSELGWGSWAFVPTLNSHYMWVAPGRKCDLGHSSLLSEGNPQTRLTAAVYLLATFPAAEEVLCPWRGIWVAHRSMSTTLTFWVTEAAFLLISLSSQSPPHPNSFSHS